MAGATNAAVASANRNGRACMSESYL
jgi:hypothetical protein